jgi:hypothetical protein
MKWVKFTDNQYDLALPCCAPDDLIHAAVRFGRHPYAQIWFDCFTVNVNHFSIRYPEETSLDEIKADVEVMLEGEIHVD